MRRFFRVLTILFVLTTPVIQAQTQNLRAATASSYIERGNAWFAKGAYERAIADYGLAIASDPGHAGAYYNRAVTLYHLKDYERAIADFTRAIQTEPLNSIRSSPGPGKITAWRETAKETTMARWPILTTPSSSTRAAPNYTAIAAWRDSG